MPYKLQETPDGWNVVKKDDDKPVNKKPLSKARAERFLAALEANVKDAKSAKSGARNSAADAKRIQAIHDSAAELGADCSAGMSKSFKDFPVMLNEYGMSAEAYAVQESWDIQQAAQALIGVVGLMNSEKEEPEDVRSICAIARGLVDFIGGEIDEMEKAGTVAEADEAAEEKRRNELLVKNFGNLLGKANLSELELVNPKHIYQLNDPAPLKTAYFKSLHVALPVDELAVKFVARDQIKGYATLWGNPESVDLEAEYFTKSTDFWSETPKWLTWDHAQDAEFKSDPRIGEILELGDDEYGKWYVAKLKKHEAYRKYLDALIEKKAVGSSSDSAPQYVQRVQTGKSIWLARWPLFAISLTDSPCEPRMIGSVETLKSLTDRLPDAPGAAWNWTAAKLSILSK